MHKFKKKYSFVLLEVLIGIALVALFALPLISFPIWQCKSEINSLKTLELERIANRIYAETLESLYKNNITWQNLESRGIHSKHRGVEKIKLWLDGKDEDLKITKFYWATKCSSDQDSDPSLYFITIKIQAEASFLSPKPSQNKSSTQKGTKTFTYKVLAKNSMEQKT